MSEQGSKRVRGKGKPLGERNAEMLDKHINARLRKAATGEIELSAAELDVFRKRLRECTTPAKSPARQHTDLVREAEERGAGVRFKGSAPVLTPPEENPFRRARGWPEGYDAHKGV